MQLDELSDDSVRTWGPTMFAFRRCQPSNARHTPIFTVGEAFGKERSQPGISGRRADYPEEFPEFEASQRF